MPSTEILRPTGNTERINSVGVIRGVALLGILLMNITRFGLLQAYFFSIVSGGTTGLDSKGWCRYMYANDTVK